MKIKISSVILTCIYISFVIGLDHKVSDPTRRVIHGDIVLASKYKFIVRVQSYIYICGGSVIASNYILTAARCVHSTICSTTRIFPSTWKMFDDSNMYATNCFYHEKHDKAKPQFYDIGILKVGVDLLKDPRFETIPLPVPGIHHPRRTPATIFGWGETETGLEATSLRKGEVFVEEWENCNKKFKTKNSLCTESGVNSTDDIPKTVLCTQGLKSRPTGICTNDYGGPVIIDGVIAGIISSTYPDAKRNCADGAPAMHTSVTDYLPWIYGIIDPDKDTSGIYVVKEDADREPEKSLTDKIHS